MEKLNVNQRVKYNLIRLAEKTQKERPEERILINGKINQSWLSVATGINNKGNVCSIIKDLDSEEKTISMSNLMRFALAFKCDITDLLEIRKFDEDIKHIIDYYSLNERTIQVSIK